MLWFYDNVITWNSNKIKPLTRKLMTKNKNKSFDILVCPCSLPVLTETLNVLDAQTCTFIAAVTSNLSLQIKFFCWHCLLIQQQVFQTNITTGDLGRHGTGRVYADFHRNFTKCCGMKVQVRDMWTVIGLPFHNYWFCRITPETIEHKGS